MFHEGYGQARRVAESVTGGTGGERVAADAEANLAEAQWALLATADATIFGLPLLQFRAWN